MYIFLNLMDTFYGYIFSRKLMFTKLSFRKIVRYYIKSSDIVDDWYVIDKIILVINTIIVCRSKKMVSEIVSTLLFFCRPMLIFKLYKQYQENWYLIYYTIHICTYNKSKRKSLIRYGYVSSHSLSTNSGTWYIQWRAHKSSTFLSKLLSSGCPTFNRKTIHIHTQL